MALIKCPECGNNISSKADSCPNCGFEMSGKEIQKNQNKSHNFFNKNSKFIIVIAIVLLAFLLFSPNNDKNKSNSKDITTSKSSNSGYLIYNDSNTKISFEFPEEYKVTKDKDGYIYVAKTINDNEATIPYVIIGKYDNFNNSVQFLNSFTDYMRKNYSDLSIVLDLVSGNVGDKLVYGIAYNYTSSNHLIVDNRYAIVIDNVVYMLGSKEENTNTTEINNVVEHIIKTLNVGGN